MNTKSRSIIKAAMWGTLAMLVTTVVCFAVLGIWSISITVGILSNLPDTLFYIFTRACFNG